MTPLSHPENGAQEGQRGTNRRQGPKRRLREGQGTFIEGRVAKRRSRKR